MSTLINQQSKEGNRSEPESLTPIQVAVKLGMTPKWVEKHTQAGRIPGQVKVGGRWRYRRKDVEEAYQSGNFLLPPRVLKSSPKNYLSQSRRTPIVRNNGV